MTEPTRKSSPLRQGLRALIAVTLLLNIFTWLPEQTSRAAAVILVNSTLDSLANDGQCTLREAVISANKDQNSGGKPGECTGGSGADTILLPGGLGVYTLTRTDNGKEDSSSTGDLDILAGVTIEASGPGVIIRGGSGYSDHIFQVHTGQVVIRGLTIEGGAAKGDGGGIYNKGVLSIENTTITNNVATGRGGGIYNAPTGTLTLVNSTISGNTSQGSGGGLSNEGSASLNNVTITANITAMNGGGAAALSGMLNASNTIISGNLDQSPSSPAPDCTGTLVSGGYNLIGSSAGCTLSGDPTGNLLDLAASLGALQDNGGYTPTAALLDGSPAIDAGSPVPPGSGGTSCAVKDQRGGLRPRGAACDIGAYEAGKPNSSVIIRAVRISAAPSGDMLTAVGRLTSAPNQTFTLQFYASPNCDPSAGGTPVGSPVTVTTNSSGNVFFNASISASIPLRQYVWATTQEPQGSLSDPSQCVRVGQGNDSWPNALRLYPDLAPDLTASQEDYLDLFGQSRWYKFSVQPNSKVIITLTGLPANYDLTLYKDIAQAYSTLNSPADLVRLDAEFAPDAFSSEAFAQEAFSPEAISPAAFSPAAFSPAAFSPAAFSPAAFSPEVFGAEAFSPDAFSPAAFSPAAFSPDAFSPAAFSPAAFSPAAFSPAAFSSAQTRSLIGISAFDGLVGEGLRVNTWDSSGDFYVRVRGRNGVFDPGAPYNLSISQIPGACTSVSEVITGTTILPDSGGYQTLILTNLPRMEGTQDEKSLLVTRLGQLAARPEVAGKIIDLSSDDRFLAAETQARENPACPYAVNLAAQTIKETVEAYWGINPSLKYLVLIGNDEVIPFFRHPDHAMLGNEKSFVPPVKDNTTSGASLRLGYVLSQDDYGSSISVSLKDDAFPLPDLGVGRLVETAAEATGMLDAYLATAGGVVNTPTSAFVSGYDFLEDAAVAMRDQLQDGLGISGSAMVDTLIAPRDLSPTDPSAWNADQLRAALLGQRHDIIFLAGHFSASSALAADYTTRLYSSELASSNVDMLNTLVFSAGCHSGYSIVNDHGLSGITREPDWAQAFARKQATLIAGTGYQYGDTDFIRYSEKLYLEFTRQLRVGAGPVSIGEALVRAKQVYLATTPYLRGIDEKSVLQATIFGLPMLSYDLPGRLPDTGGEPPSVPGTQAVVGDPGEALGLESYDLEIQPQTVVNTRILSDVENPGVVSQATYLSGSHDVISKPNEPVLPLAQYNVSVAGSALRGVGLRGGSYLDMLDILPFTGAPSTEIRGVHSPFQSNYFFPVQLWRANYFSALNGGSTLLNVFPAQYHSSTPTSITGTLRRFNQLNLRLFYSSNTATYTTGAYDSTPALAAAPSIVRVSSQVGNGQVHFQVRAVGDPAAGIQQVWVTYTGLSAPLYGSWASQDLQQNPLDSTLWEAVLPLNNIPAGDVRYIVQAVSGVGLVSMDTNQGGYYIPGVDPGVGDPTALELVPNTQGGQVPASGRYTEPVTFSALLTSGGAPLAGKPVAFILGPQARLATTDSSGLATATLSIYGITGSMEVRASFAGDGIHQASFAASPFNIDRQNTQITLNPQPASGYAEDAGVLTANLMDVSGRPLGEETVFFVLQAGPVTYYEAVITDYAGRASIGPLPLPPGSYQVSVYFSGQVPLSETINLSDDRYEPSAYLNGSLVLLNHLPQANADSFLVDEDNMLSIPAPGVLGNDTDLDGSPLTVSLASGPNHGTLQLNPDGSFTYAPQANYHGSDTFSYFANDGMDSTLAVVAIQVTSVNDVPQAFAEMYTALEDTDLVVPAPGVLSNDFDIDGDALSAVLVSQPASGSVALNQDGSFSYHPQPEFSGSVSFSYAASDGQASSVPALVTIDVSAVNDPPRCIDALPSPDSLWPPNGQFIPVSLINITDPEGDPFSVLVNSVFQDEPVGSQADAILQGAGVQLRAERDGNGNGRVYHIYFTAVDVYGAACSGDVRIGVVPHDQSGNTTAIDDGPQYNSTMPQ